jgi:hypothetical protein
MEALLEREGAMDSWNDERLDELSRRMDAGFSATADKEETNRRFDEGAAQLERFESHVRTEFHRFTDRLDKLFYLQLAFMTSLAVGLLTHAI